MDKEKTYKKYMKATNISCEELKKWRSNPCSEKASLNREPINRNIRLQCKPKDKWTEKDIIDAKKAISYLARAKKIKKGKTVKGCGLTKNQIALRNWAYSD